jgi:hypothetical protein
MTPNIVASLAMPSRSSGYRQQIITAQWVTVLAMSFEYSAAPEVLNKCHWLEA